MGRSKQVFNNRIEFVDGQAEKEETYIGAIFHFVRIYKLYKYLCFKNTLFLLDLYLEISYKYFLVLKDFLDGLDEWLWIGIFWPLIIGFSFSPEHLFIQIFELNKHLRQKEFEAD